MQRSSSGGMPINLRNLLFRLLLLLILRSIFRVSSITALPKLEWVDGGSLGAVLELLFLEGGFRLLAIWGFVVLVRSRPPPIRGLNLAKIKDYVPKKVIAESSQTLRSA